MPTKIEVDFNQVPFTNLVKNKRKLKFFLIFWGKEPLPTRKHLPSNRFPRYICFYTVPDTTTTLYNVMTTPRRVTFSHDSDSLMKPLPTVRVTFNINLSPDALMVESKVEHVAAPERKPLRRLFGSLADLCAALDNPECRDCDTCRRTYDAEHNWHHSPANPEKEWMCDTCHNDEILSGMSDIPRAGEEEKVPETEEKVECPNCWCDTTQRELDGDGCSECLLGTNTDERGLGIGCDFCERCYSDDCDWWNGNHVLAEYDIPHDWLAVCPECQKDTDLLERLDADAEEYAAYYFGRNHTKKFNPVLDQILESHGWILPSACGFPKSKIAEIQRESEKVKRLNEKWQRLYGEPQSSEEANLFLLAY